MDDLRHGGLHKLHIHYAGADDLARHGCDLAGDKLAAVLPGLYGLGFAKIQPRVLDGLGLKRQLPGHGLVPHGLDLQKVVCPQCGGQVAVRCDGRGRVDAVHQPQGVDKVGLHTVGLPRRTHGVQKLPQVVALVGDEPQRAVQIDGGALGDLAACARRMASAVSRSVMGRVSASAMTRVYAGWTSQSATPVRRACTSARAASNACSSVT